MRVQLHATNIYMQYKAELLLIFEKKKGKSKPCPGKPLSKSSDLKKVATFHNANKLIAYTRHSLKSWAGQIGHSVATAATFFKRSCVVRVQWSGDGPRQLITRFGVTQRV